MQNRWGFSTDNIDCTDYSIIAESGYVTARGLEHCGSQWSLLLHAPLFPAYLNSQEAQGVDVLRQSSRHNAVMAYLNPTQRMAVSQQPFARTLLREPSSAANTPAFFPEPQSCRLYVPALTAWSIRAFSGKRSIPACYPLCAASGSEPSESEPESSLCKLIQMPAAAPRTRSEYSGTSHPRAAFRREPAPNHEYPAFPTAEAATS